MPKSRVRQKKVYTPPSEIAPRISSANKRRPSPTWVPATALVLIFVGIAWLVVYYLSAQEYPVASWQYWNLAIGFGSMVASLPLLARWR
ncbi:MAG: cell division protein CrgA [Micromonosporaceae bacterium]|nr:cell division protein CrgA [Micromonosporaceae bacterium]